MLFNEKVTILLCHLRYSHPRKLLCLVRIFWNFKPRFRYCRRQSRATEVNCPHYKDETEVNPVETKSLYCYSRLSIDRQVCRECCLRTALRLSENVYPFNYQKYLNREYRNMLILKKFSIHTYLLTLVLSSLFLISFIQIQSPWDRCHL